MKSEDIVFDENLELYTILPYTNLELCVALSDELEASEEVLTKDYKANISNFINQSDLWYEKSIAKIKEVAKKNYKQIIKEDDIELIGIFVLFEQQEEELYGLEFRVGFDVEHGCGIKMNTSNFEIIEIGGADVAFC